MSEKRPRAPAGITCTLYEGSYGTLWQDTAFAVKRMPLTSSSRDHTL